MPETVATTIEQLDTLEGEQYRTAVYSLLEKPEIIRGFDERIIDRVLTSHSDFYFIVPLMKALVIHGRSDVSDKAFDRISDIHYVEWESEIYASLCKSDEKKYGEKIGRIIQKISDDDLKSEIIVRCVVRTGNPDFIQWYEYVNNKKKREHILDEISVSIPPGFYDRIDPVIKKYRTEIKNT